MTHLASTGPPLLLITGPARSGKTAAAVDTAAAAPSGIVLAPSRSALARLGLPKKARDGKPGAVLPRDFAADLTEHVEQRGEPIDRPQQRVILGALVHRKARPDGYFGRVLASPGFGGALLDIVAELKRSMVYPDALLAAATEAADTVDDPNFLSKAREVCDLYTAYEELLREHHLLDEEDRMLAATSAVLDGSARVGDLRCVCLDGFHRLSAAWRALLGALAARGVEVVVTLPWQPDRPLLFATPGRTREQLMSAFTVTERALRARSDARPDVLVRLERSLFGGDDAAPAPPADPGALALWDTPNPYFEAEMIARALRREADERGTPWGRMAVIVRAAASTNAALPAVCERYGVPILPAESGPLAEAPCARRLLLLLRVIAEDWRRESVVAFLKASLHPGLRIRADQIGRAASREALRAGRDRWQALIAEMRADGDPVAALLRAMLEWDKEMRSAAVTPTEWAERLIPVVNHAAIGAHDARNTDALRAAIARFSNAANAAGRGAMPVAALMHDLEQYLEGVRQVSDGGEDQVAVLEAGDARARDIEFAVASGLVERTFPRRVSEDPFFRDDERAALTAAGAELEQRGLLADEERLHFYNTVTAPSRRLVLSYPRSAEEADTLRSFFVDEAEAAVGGIPTVVRSLTDVAPTPEQCVDAHDRLLAACAAVASGSPTPPGLSADDAAAAAECMEARSLPPYPRLTAPDARRAYTTPRAFGVTEIEQYAECPMRHLLAYGIKLRPERDGAGPADRGAVYHRALSRWLRRTIERRSIPETETLTEELAEEMEACLAEHPVDAPPHRVNLMRRALIDAAHSLGTREPAYRDAFGVFPRWAELSFGPQAPEHDDPDAGPEDAPDAASVRDTLDLRTADGRTVRLCGRLDRVDTTVDGQVAVLVDYKLGKAPDINAIRSGTRIQMPVYSMALQEIWHLTPAVTCYDSAATGTRDRICHRDRVDARQFAPLTAVESGVAVNTLTPGQSAEFEETAKRTVFAAAEGIEDGAIAPAPGGWCETCPYGDVCRTTLLDGHDGEQPAPSPDEPGRV